MPSLFYAGQPDYIEKLNTLATAASMTNGTVAASFLSLAVTGTATAASFVGPLTGNASTATTLATARNINGVSFNGSADITVTAAAGTLTGNTLAAGVTASSLTSVGTLSALTVSGQASITANSASAALTVTQTGAGNAFVVEDQASDTTQFGVSSGGQVFVGHTSQPFFISGVVPQFSTIGTNNTSGQFATVMYSNDASPTWLHLGKSRGAIGAQGIVSSGDTVGNIEFSASDGTIFTSVARIAAVVDGTPGTNDMPGRLVFSTTADGASSPTERMRIDSAGKVGIGTAALTNYSFLNGLALTGQTTMIGNGTVAQVNSDVTSLAVGYRSNLYTQAASFNCGAFYGFHAVQSTLGASSSVSFQAGFLAGSTLTGATNNFGVYSEIASGANRYNFYAAGTALNYFAGPIAGGGYISTTGFLGSNNATATPAGGSAGSPIVLGGAANFGVYFGSGAPTLSATKGSLYLRSDGSTTNDRMYVNTDGSTTWTAVITAA